MSLSGTSFPNKPMNRGRTRGISLCCRGMPTMHDSISNLLPSSLPLKNMCRGPAPERSLFPSPYLSGPMSPGQCEKWWDASGHCGRNRKNSCHPSYRHHRYHLPEACISPLFRRPRRKRPSRLARLLFSSCLIAVSSSDGELIKECTEPQPVESTFSNPASRWLPTVSPREGHRQPQLGDGIRSTEASGVFFDSLDLDLDGAIEPEEVAMFLQNEIGGKQFDTQSENLTFKHSSLVFFVYSCLQKMISELLSLKCRSFQNHSRGERGS